MRNKRPCAIYYYSKYERTLYRKLQAKYPDVCSANDIEELFDPKDGQRNRVYPPWVTFIAFLGQVLSRGSACREAVRRVQA